MRRRLDATNITVRDIGDQPPSRYVLMVDQGPGERRAVAVDGWYVDDVYASFWRDDQVTVAVVPTHMNWVVMEREVLEAVPMQAYAMKVAADEKDMKALAEELYPSQEGQKRPQLVVLDGGLAEQPAGAYL